MTPPPSDHSFIDLLIHASHYFMPHRHCMAGEAWLVWGYVISDSAIALSYAAIPAALLRMWFKLGASRRSATTILLMFIAFILTCGICHAADVWVMWRPDYVVGLITRAATASISLVTAFVLWRLVNNAQRADPFNTKFEVLVQAIPGMTFELDREGRYLYFNTRGQGYVADHRLLGTRFQDLMPEEALEKLEPAFEDALNGKLSVVDYDLLMDGRRLSYQARFALTEMDTVLCCAYDVTNEVEYRNELERTNADLMEFAYAVSHDLKAPIRNMEWLAGEILQEAEGKLSEEGEENLRFLISEASKATGLIGESLELSKSQVSEVTPESLDLKQIIDHILKSHKLLIDTTGADIRIGPLEWVEYDKAGLKRILSNLITNAIKFHQPQKPPRVTIWSEPMPNDQVAIRIRDDGIGIPLDQQEAVFQVGKRLTSRSGTGYGLSIVQNTISKCKGKLEMASEPGVGTEFIVTVPLARR